jgi:hypothetical protein
MNSISYYALLFWRSLLIFFAGGRLSSVKFVKCFLSPHYSNEVYDNPPK